MCLAVRERVRLSRALRRIRVEAPKLQAELRLVKLARTRDNLQKSTPTSLCSSTIRDAAFLKDYETQCAPQC